MSATTDALEALGRLVARATRDVARTDAGLREISDDASIIRAALSTDSEGAQPVAWMVEGLDGKALRVELSRVEAERTYVFEHRLGVVVPLYVHAPAATTERVVVMLDDARSMDERVRRPLPDAMEDK